MASFSSRKKRERTPSPSEGESSSGSAQGESQGVTEHLALMFLGHVYFQLDLLHGDEAKGDSCYAITLSLYYAIL